jgi:hypothetical protein
LFIIADVLEEYREPLAGNTNTQAKALEFDIFVPSLQLAFEYQGVSHLVDIGIDNAKRKGIRDYEKYQLCSSKGITLIEVYEKEWDGGLEAIRRAILEARPDLSQSMVYMM